MSQQIAIDIGGTFTDFVAYDGDSQRLSVWKTLTTPQDPIEGIVAGLERAGAAAIGGIRLGTTIATNALLEKKGAVVGLLTTRGTRDVAFIQRGKRKSHYDITWIKSKPLLNRRHCYEVAERLTAEGAVHQALDEQQVRSLARSIRDQGLIESIAVSFLFSYVSPEHERRVREILLQELPGIPVSISYDVLPKWKEYERTATTIADAYVKPLVARDMDRIRERFVERGIVDRVSVIRSNGGEMTLEAAAQAPIHLTVSGPTGGVVGARYLAQSAQVDHLVTFDMGGTSTDVSTVVGGRESFTTNFQIEFGVPIQIPMIDIRSIGAGGGSIAWIDKGGMLRVGPHSAGAQPGPACYGRGGVEATVTDANVVLGRISPENFLGGEYRLDADAAHAAVGRIARLIGRERETTALAIVQIVNNNMVGALRGVLTERGLDPRDFTLLGFGGAGPVHVCDLMHDFNIPNGIVPNYPGQFSAFGFVMTDARVDHERTAQMTSHAFDAERATRVLRELTHEAVGALKRQGYHDNIEIFRALELRYFWQNHELEVPIDFDEFVPRTIEQVWRAFHAMHLARFDFQIPGEKIELTTIKVTAVARTAKPDLPTLPPARGQAPPRSRRRVVYEDGGHDTPVYQRADLMAGHRVSGPALIEEPASVTVLRPGQRLEVDGHGNLRIHADAAAGT